MKQLKKIIVMGTTGSGKTTFLRKLVGDFDGSEVKRNIRKEEAQQLNTFTIMDKNMEESTTTVSMNAKTVTFYTTMANQFGYITPAELHELEGLDMLYPTMIVDVAGQERFSFMSEICIPGAQGAIIFADGTNVQSLERVFHYIGMVRDEEQRSGTKIPIAVLVNKKDLESKGLFVGSDFLYRIIPDGMREGVEIYETSNYDFDTILLPLRILLNSYADFPIDASEALSV